MVGFVNFVYFCKWHFGRSRSSKAIWHQSKARMRLPISQS